jgi:hypothetical protein
MNETGKKPLLRFLFFAYGSSEEYRYREFSNFFDETVSRDLQNHGIKPIIFMCLSSFYLTLSGCSQL